MTIKIRTQISPARAKHLTALNIEEHESDETQHTCDINLRLPFTDIENDEGEKIKGSLYVSSITTDEISILISELKRLSEIITEAQDKNINDCCNIDTKIIAQHYYDSNNVKYIRTDEQKR